MAAERAPLTFLLFIYVLSIFWCIVLIPGMLWKLLRVGPKRFFGRKSRDTRPEVLDDPSLGTHAFARLKSLKLHYVISGPESGPLMLFLHGFPEFWYTWRHQLREFAKDYRCVAVDMRGYGESDKPADISNYTMDKLVGDVKELIQALGYSKCTLVAHDWGGAVAWDFAWRNPDLLDNLIICNAPNGKAFRKHLETSKSQLLKSWYMYVFQLHYIPEGLIGLEDYNFIQLAFTGPKWGAQRQGAFTADDIEAFKYNVSVQDGLTCPINYYRANMRYRNQKYTKEKVEVPTLIVWGTADAALEKELATLSAQFCEDCTVQFIEGASHWVQQEEPEKTNMYIREFLSAKSK